MKTLNVFIKEMKQYFTEIKLNVLIYLIMPIIIATVYGIMYKSIVDPNRTIEKFTVGYIDYDKSNVSKPLINIFNNKKLKNIMNLKEETSLDVIKKNLINGNFSSAIIIPQNFSHSICNGKNSTVQVLKSPSGGINADIVESIVKGYVNSLNANMGVYGALLKNIKNVALTQKIYNGVLPEIISTVNENHIANVNFNKAKKTDSKQEFASNMLIMFSFFIALKQAIGALNEKEEGTFQRVKSVNKSMLSYYAGKLLSTWLMALIQIFSFIILTSLITGVKWGNLWLLTLTGLVHSFVIVTITLMLMSFFKSKKLMTGVSILLIAFMSILSGTFYPSEYMFGYGKTISNLTINHLIQSCYQNIMIDNGFTYINSNLAILSLASIVLIILGIIKQKFSDKEE